MRKIARTSALSVICAAALASGCASTGTSQAAGNSGVTAELVRLMHESAAAWNRADLEGFLTTYANDAVFIGRNVTIGMDAIRTSYQQNYFRDGQPRQQLAFDELETRMLGPNHALMRGRCILTNPADNKQTFCRYTLVWERRPDGWKIIHDHSS